MNVYINVITGAIVYSDCPISGENWQIRELAAPAAKRRPKNADKDGEKENENDK